MSAPPPAFTSQNLAGDIHERIAQAIKVVCEGVLGAMGQKITVTVNLVPVWDAPPGGLPCIFVTWDEITEENEDLDFEGNLITYPIHVLFCDRTDLRNNTNRRFYLAARKNFMDQFRALATYTGVPEVYDVKVRPEVILNPDLPAYQHVISGFTVLSFTWEPRATAVQFPGTATTT